MTEEWVPFQKRLAKGAKRGLPRGVRFVLLELSLEARPGHGVLDLPLGWTTEKAVHDRIGGNRKEINRALKEFTKPDADGVQVLRIERDETKHRLIISKWSLHAGPKSSTPRVQLHRDRKRYAELATDETVTAVALGNGETLYSTGQYRTEQNNPPLPPEGGEEEDPDSPTEPSAPVPPVVVVHDGGRKTTYDAAWALWRELYEKSRRQYGRYVEVFIQDDRVVQRLAHRAQDLAGGDRPRTMALLRHWFVSYLREDGDLSCQANARHPLRLIERRLPTYGDLPKPPAKRIAKAHEPEPPPLSPEEHLAAIERARAMARGIGDTKKGSTA
jgi:hypothetical protein